MKDKIIEIKEEDNEQQKHAVVRVKSFEREDEKKLNANWDARIISCKDVEKNVN